jgi:hypothetical protein
MEIINITPENVVQETFFCIKNTKDPGFQAKYNWFKKRSKEGLKIKILKNEGKPFAFIEYVPVEYAWRPVDGENYMFIHCMYTNSNKEKGKGYASKLIETCEAEAKEKRMNGVAVMTSKGSWITDRRIFEKQGYEEIEKQDRFELLVKQFNSNAPRPKLINWQANISKLKGWQLLYSDQCPWHQKAVVVIKEITKENGIDIKIQKIETAAQAKKMPSGFGVFNLVHEGKLLADHYISGTRFKNILKKELS